MWTDALQTVFMLVSVVLTIFIITKALDFNFSSAWIVVQKSPLSRVFDFDWRSGQNTIKQFLAGMAITVSLNGLDQNMMQKNLTCRSLRDCKINMFSFSFFFLVTNLLFLLLGVLLYVYADQMGIVLPEKSDEVFPFLSLNHFGALAALFFILGITAAAYSSVDSSLTSLTTSFCIDFLKIDPKNAGEKKKRMFVHVIFSLLMVLVVVLFREVNNTSVISALFKAVGYTYGPLLGLFAFGLTTKYMVKEKFLPWVCFISPVLSYVINCYSEQLLFGYKFGFEILLFNGILCYSGLLLFREKKSDYKSMPVTTLNA